MSLIVVASGKGGSTKTTTAHALGGAFVEVHTRGSTFVQLRDAPPLLIDLDPGASLTEVSGFTRDGTNALDFFSGRAGVDELAVRADEGYDLLPASARLAELAGAPVEILSERFRALPKDRLIVADTAQTVANPLTRAAVVAADVLVVPIKPERAVVSRSLTEIAAVLATTGHEPEMVFVAVQVLKQTSVHRKYLTDLAEHGFEFSAIVPQTIAIAEADHFARSIIGYPTRKDGGGAEAADEYRKLATAIIARLSRAALSAAFTAAAHQQ